MRRSLLRNSFAAALLAVVALDAHANWQYTHWGMPKDQVMLASNGVLFDVMTRWPSAPYVGLRGKYETRAHTFDAAMLFDAGDALTGVILSQRSARECRETLADLSQKYGTAQDAAPRPGSTQLAWNDTKSGNRVKYDGTAHSNRHDAGNPHEVACTVIYEPLTAATADGL